jgi:hypothetical protein
MLIIPVLIFFGGLVGLSLLSGGATVRNKSGQIVSGRDVFQTQRPALKRLLDILRLRREPSNWAIDDAMAEAYDVGDWKMVAKLHHRFYHDIETDEIGEIDDDQDEQPNEGEEREENDPPDDAPTDVTAGTVIGRSSPFDGVPNESWDRFVSSLETQKEDYQGPKHVGRFHHSKERLSQLKIADVSTGEKQYEALVTDLVDAREKSQALIREFEFQPIALESGEHVITLSGLLAVIKSAGMEHARSWFVNPEDRKKFPKTTEMFSKANGAF